MTQETQLHETRSSARRVIPPRPQRYFVTSGRSGGWLIFREGRMRALRGVEQKIVATETAKVLARQDAPSEVWVEQRDGSFIVQYAFGAGGFGPH